MTNEIRMSKLEQLAFSSFVLRHPFIICHSVIRH